MPDLMKLFTIFFLNMFVTSLLNLPGSYKIYNSFSIKKTIQLIPPLHANPRRIDVGEGQNSNFAKELLKHNLLTASDEFELAKQFKVGVQIKVQSRLLDQQYGREATHREIAEALEISAEQVRVLIDKSEAAKKILVRANMRLVFHIARYYRFRGVAYPDLVQEAPSAS